MARKGTSQGLQQQPVAFFVTRNWCWPFDGGGQANLTSAPTTRRCVLLLSLSAVWQTEVWWPNMTDDVYICHILSAKIRRSHVDWFRFPSSLCGVGSVLQTAPKNNTKKKTPGGFALPLSCVWLLARVLSCCCSLEMLLIYRYFSRGTGSSKYRRRCTFHTWFTSLVQEGNFPRRAWKR